MDKMSFLLILIHLSGTCETVMKLITVIPLIIIQCFFVYGQKTDYMEKYRLQFHFSPPAHWMNDPNGLVFYNNEFHLFYQYNPNDNVWGPMHWGHATSKDLMHWKHYPIALYPDSLGTIFSGSAVIDKDNTAGFGKNAMVAIFTYHNDSLWVKGFKNTESQGIAYSLDQGITWEKYKNNPVLNNSGEKDFRDPKVFWNENHSRWNMVLAAGDRIKIFSSEDLTKWIFESDFKPADDIADLGTWECPDLFQLHNTNSKNWVMIINHSSNAPNGGSGTRYFTGDFDGKIFRNEQHSRWLDYGKDFYAGVTFSNTADQQRILISWMSNWQYATKVPTETWRSSMTLARLLTLDRDESGYFIRQEFPETLNVLKTVVRNTDKTRLPYSESGIDFSQTEISFTSAAKDLKIIFSNTVDEQLIIGLESNQLFIDRRKSGKIAFSEKFADKIQTMPLQDDIYNFQIILDKASVEILLNDGKYSMTNVFFPNEGFSNLQISSSHKAILRDIRINRINSVWNTSPD
jgi:fructan beta-fructosidase